MLRRTLFSWVRECNFILCLEYQSDMLLSAVLYPLLSDPGWFWWIANACMNLISHFLLHLSVCLLLYLPKKMIQLTHWWGCYQIWWFNVYRSRMKLLMRLQHERVYWCLILTNKWIWKIWRAWEWQNFWRMRVCSRARTTNTEVVMVVVVDNIVAIGVVAILHCDPNPVVPHLCQALTCLTPLCQSFLLTMLALSGSIFLQISSPSSKQGSVAFSLTE